MEEELQSYCPEAEVELVELDVCFTELLLDF